MSGRGTTRVGKRAATPDGDYLLDPTPPRPLDSELIIKFSGEDGRSREFNIASLPLPGWHVSLAACLRARVGPSGRLRTLTSANGAWAALVRWMRYLESTPRPPQSPSKLTAQHVDSFWRHREIAIGPGFASRDVRDIAKLLTARGFADLLQAEARDRLIQPATDMFGTPLSGYSDGELARLVAAARADVLRLRTRLDRTADLLKGFMAAPDELSSEDRASAEKLAEIVGTGQVQTIAPGSASQMLVARADEASPAFVTRRDLVPLLVLLVAVTGWNLEAIKELPASHRVIEGLAVEVGTIKRRRGAGRWHQTATWEIGPPGRELHTPGGVYLLLHRLMGPARALLGTDSFWAVWHNRSGPYQIDQGIRDPFADRLTVGLYANRWIAKHGIRADAPEAPAAGQRETELLGLNFNRLKTSIDVRRTRQMGGHLPSSARSNTTAVLFRNYLRNDQTTIDWAHALVAEALTEVETAAWAAHQEALATTGRQSLRVIASAHGGADGGSVDALTQAGYPEAFAKSVIAGDLDTGWSACVDHEHHPLTGRRCGMSFLDCFNCGNSLIIGEHVPGLLGLVDALEERRAYMSEESWWARYGSVWAAIRGEILPKFSEAEIARAVESKPPDALLDLVEPRWERP